MLIRIQRKFMLLLLLLLFL